jgi:hypothetical protein
MIFILGTTAKGHGDSKIDDDDDDSDSRSQTNVEDALIQSSSQIGSGSLKRKRKSSETNDDFITKVAHLVSQKFSNAEIPIPRPRPVNTTWSNYDLTPPSTSVFGNVNTSPPLHFNQSRIKNDFNDSFGNYKCINLLINYFDYQIYYQIYQFFFR